MTKKRLIKATLPSKDIGDILPNNHFHQVRQALSRLVETPHGGDKKLGAFYQSVFNLSGENNHFARFFATSIDIAVKRGISTSLFINLFYRGAQYVDIHRRGRIEYDESFLSHDAWSKLLVGNDGFINNEGKTTSHGNVLQDILKTRETTTTIYQRYAGPNAVLNILKSNQEICVADFGCGANYGLRGLKGNLDFEEISVNEGTHPGHSRTLNKLFAKQISISEGLGVDKNPLDGEEELKWRVACSFYPGELNAKNREALMSLEKKVADVSGIDFLQGNLLKLKHNHHDGTLPADKFDAVILSTILYQMQSDGEKKKVIETARKCLCEDGVIILQDFAERDEKNRSKLDFKDSASWGIPYSYRTFIMRKDSTNWDEILQWENGRCRAVRPGADFDELIPPTPARGSVKNVYSVQSA